MLKWRLILVNKKKVRSAIKRAWIAFSNHEYDKLSGGHESTHECYDNWEAFAKAMADIAWAFGIKDGIAPSDWEDV